MELHVDPLVERVVVYLKDGSMQHVVGEHAQRLVNQYDVLMAEGWQPCEPRERPPLTRKGRTVKFRFAAGEGGLTVKSLRDLIAAVGKFDAEHPFVTMLAEALASELGVGEVKGYLQTGEYEDGRLCEIFVVLDRAGTLLRGLVDCVAQHVSVRLQCGEPVAAVVDKMLATKFEPAGFTGCERVPRATSVLDFIARWLLAEYGPKPEVE